MTLYETPRRHPFTSRAWLWALVLSVTFVIFAARPSAAAESSLSGSAVGESTGDGTLVEAGLSPAVGLTELPAFSPAPPTRGVYIPGAAQDPAILSAFEALTGAPVGIVQWYQPWGYDRGAWYQPALDQAALARVTAHGAVPLITWEPWGKVASAGGRDPSRVASILGGEFDSYIDEWARGLKSFAKPVYLRPFHEMNNPAQPWAIGQNGNTAADEVAAWRYLHARFARIGASNVLWVWSPNTENNQVAFSQFYPGDANVDWLSVDGYNGGTQLNWGGWLSPQQVFGRSYASLVALSPAKPIMIAETSTVEQGGSKAEWIQQLFNDLPTAFPNVRAIIWFHADTSARGEADWRVDTTPGALEAFKLVAKPQALA